jgi:glycosyltransferase involved in cell wall biosynthesis
MKISILTVCYNSEKTIEKTFQSVANQTFKNVEYIVIDGASKDGTLDLIKKYENVITTYISEKDKGLYDAMNKGIQLATGDYVGILN